MFEKSDCEIEAFLGAGVFGFGGVEQLLGVGKFTADLCLSLLEVVDGDGLGEVGVDQFLFLPLKSGDPAPLGLTELGVALTEASELVVESVSDLGAEVGGEGDGSPQVDHSVFNSFGGEVREVAISAFGVASKTEEVLVFAAVAAVVTEPESFSAAMTVDGAF